MDYSCKDGNKVGILLTSGTKWLLTVLYSIEQIVKQERKLVVALTRDFKDLIKQRADRDPEFRRGLVIYAMEAFLDNDVDTCKASLRTYVNATVGFEKLGKEMGRQPISLRGVLSESRNPLANNLVAIICFLKKREGIEIKISASGNPLVET